MPITEPGVEEVEHAIADLLRDEEIGSLAVLGPDGPLETFAKGTAHHQTFIRIDPVEVLCNDNIVRLLWRRIATFTPDGKHVAALSHYETKLREAPSVDGDGKVAR